MELGLVGIILIIILGIAAVAFAIWIYYTVYIAFMEIRDATEGIDQSLKVLVNDTNNARD